LLYFNDEKASNCSVSAFGIHGLWLHSGSHYNANKMPCVIQAVDIQDKAAVNEDYVQAGMRLYHSNCMTSHAPETKAFGNFPHS
jgi:hypothetical protein